jgi:hypothetical protein
MIETKNTEQVQESFQFIFHVIFIKSAKLVNEFICIQTLNFLGTARW